MTGGGKEHHSRHRRPGLIKELEGNRAKLGKAKIKQDPTGIGLPRMPAHLMAHERELWADVVASLPVGLLSRADDQALERIAVAWAEFREMQTMIRKSGKLVKSPQGPIRNPLLVIRDRAMREMHLAGEVLGLSPVARARLAAVETADNDPMALLLGDDGNPDGAWSTAPRTRQ
jgi:P27 family predicted phage terminase small subunit